MAHVIADHRFFSAYFTHSGHLIFSFEFDFPVDQDSAGNNQILCYLKNNNFYTKISGM